MEHVCSRAPNIFLTVAKWQISGQRKGKADFFTGKTHAGVASNVNLTAKGACNARASVIQRSMA